jgi:hypothetical protein
MLKKKMKAKWHEKLGRVNDVAEMMSANIERVLERSDKLSALDAKTELLGKSAGKWNFYLINTCSHFYFCVNPPSLNSINFSPFLVRNPPKNDSKRHLLHIIFWSE